MKDYAQKLLDKLTLGQGDFVDIRFQNSEALTLQVKNGITSDVASTRLGGAAARALINGAWGFCTTAEVNKKSLKQILNSAVSMAKVASEKVKEPRKVSSEYVFEGEHKLSFEGNPKDYSIEEKLKLALDFNKSISAVDERIANANTFYVENVSTETVVNSFGTSVTSQNGAFRLFSQAVAREGNLQQNVTDDIASSNGVKGVMEFPTAERGEALGKKGVQLLGAVAPKSGKMNIIMDPSLVGVFVHEAFGHACEADGIITKNSILHDKLNKKVGVEEINIIDDPTLPNLRGTFAYDSEGTKAQRRQLVQDGVLKEFFHTLETATILGAKPNGAGRAMDFKSPPLARMGNTAVEAGDKSIKELLEIVGDGMYLQKSFGGYVNPAKGQFMFSSQQGYIIENGEQKEITQNVSMSGMILEVLENTIGVGNDREAGFNGTCGKGGQWVPVTGGGPSLAVKDVVVGGR